MKKYWSWLAAAAAAMVMSPAVEGAPAKRGVIRFSVEVQHERRGRVYCGLYANERTWLSDKTFRDATAAVKGRWATCVFRNVPTGRIYGLTALHDEDGDGEMDFNWIGIPEEGYAASRDAHRKHLGAPRWKDARFRHKRRTVQRAHVKY